MRELNDHGTPKTLSSEVYSAMQLYTINEPLLPNLTTLKLGRVEKSFISFIPLFLSPTTTSISFGFDAPLPPKFVVASMIINLPTLCPNLQDINLFSLPRDPMITTAVSRMVCSANRNALRNFHVDSPLTEEAREAISKSQNLRALSVVTGNGTSISSASLPNLKSLQIECEDGGDWLQLLRGATFGKLESVNFYLKSRPIGDFLEAFEEAALSSSIQNTLSAIHFFAIDDPGPWSWNPNYSSLLPFTQLVYLNIESSCDDRCSRVDDDIVIDISRAMPELKHLELGIGPCCVFTGGATAKGLVALAHNCPNLSCLSVHFQVASLSDPPTGLERSYDAGYSASWTGCALTKLEVGEMLGPEESAPMVALTLLRIFPRLEDINFMDEGWEEVRDMIRCSKRILDCSSKYHYFAIPRNTSLTLLRSQYYDRQLGERGMGGTAHS